jgi:hypothetical protein
LRRWHCCSLGAAARCAATPCALLVRAR